MFFKRPRKEAIEDNTAEDARLVENARANPADFALLYEQYFPRIYRYCLRRLGQAEEAEDVTAQVFTRAFAGLEGYRGGSVAAWLFRIAHNAVSNQLRARRPQVSFEEASNNGGIEELVEPGEEILDKLVRLEERRELAALIEALPPEQKELLALSVAGGLTAREVGQVLGKSEGAVWMALHRIVQRLKTEYSRQYREKEAENYGKRKPAR